MRLPDDVLGSGDPIVSWLPGVRLTGAAFVSFRFGSKSAVAPTAAHCRFTFNCGRTVALPNPSLRARIEVIDSRQAALS